MAEARYILPTDARQDILTLAAFIQSVIDQRTDALLNDAGHDWQARFETSGDMAYGQFNGLLLQPLRRTLSDAGLKPTPRLPGSFQSSREWGNADETHQQRWFYSVVSMAGGDALGALAVGSHHDHHRFRMPRPPEVLAVRATTPAAIEREIGRRLPEYARAQPFRDWWRDFQKAHAAP